MNKTTFSPRSIYPILLMAVVLTFAILACGASAPAEEPVPAEPAIPEATQAAQEEPADEEPLVPIPTQSIAPTQLPSIPEQRRLTLEFPPQIRAGDSDVILLTLEVDTLGNITPTAQFDGNVVTGEVVEIPDLYETHNVIAEAKFEVAGMQVSPPELISQTLSRGQSVNFIWSVRPTEVGVYRGTVWFYLRFVDKVSGEESRKTVSAQIVEIEAVNFLGLPANVVRTFGGVGSIIGAVVGFPFFEDIVKFIFGRRKIRKR